MRKISTLVFHFKKFESEIIKRSIPQGYLKSRDEEKLDEYPDAFSPPPEAVNAVLNFARSLEVKKTRSVGNIEYVLN